MGFLSCWSRRTIPEPLFHFSPAWVPQRLILLLWVIIKCQLQIMGSSMHVSELIDLPLRKPWSLCEIRLHLWCISHSLWFWVYFKVLSMLCKNGPALQYKYKSPHPLKTSWMGDVIVNLNPLHGQLIPHISTDTQWNVFKVTAISWSCTCCCIATVRTLITARQFSSLSHCLMSVSVWPMM